MPPLCRSVFSRKQICNLTRPTAFTAEDVAVFGSLYTPRRTGFCGSDKSRIIVSEHHFSLVKLFVVPV